MVVMHIERPVAKQQRPADAKMVFEGSIFSVYQWQQQLYDGRTATYEQLTRPDSACVLAVTPDGKILITRQLQPAVHEEFVGLPGGIIDAGEDPLTAAQRELREETGYTAKNWQLWYSLQPASRIDWACFTFVAFDAQKTESIHLDGGEQITLDLVTAPEFVAALKEIDFRDTDVVVEVLRKPELFIQMLQTKKVQ